MSECRILNDEELEQQSMALDKSNMREWKTTPANSRPFDKGFIKTPAFPKAFKSYHLHTISSLKSQTLVEKVKNMIAPLDKGEQGADSKELS